MAATGESTKVKQPDWHQPVNAQEVPALRLLNSLTKTKTPLVPRTGKKLTWYNCGPTVYDVSHMGHARLYVTIDIMRRVLEDYFNYDIQFVMNITDIDDKIILRARQNHLFEQLKGRTTAITGELVAQVDDAFGSFVAQKLGRFDASLADASAVWAAWPAFAEKAANIDAVPGAVDDPKLPMHLSAAKAAYAAMASAKAALNGGSAVDAAAAQQLLEGARDVVMPWLDAQQGHAVTRPEIFRELAAYWEGEYMKDMAALNVRPCNVLTRVSEYVPEIVRYVEGIIQNGYAYEAEGSVYFDTRSFDGQRGHHYAKLAPWSAGSTSLLEEGEGSLGAKLSGKRNPADFALWKRSKPGEPAWDSPWGSGRPGWHIECSVMASEVLGSCMDIHSGGIDLAFPHHDNELAQSEAYHECQQWVNYFVHPGHLHIEGQKMSKSLKNFISIREALEKYTARQLRLCFLMQQWDSPLDFKASTMDYIIGTEKTFNNFFTNVSAYIEEWKAVALKSSGQHQYREAEKELMQSLADTQAKVHAALCDSIDTPTAMRELLDIVNRANIYLGAQSTPYVPLLENIAQYITKMFKVFGLVNDGVDIGFGRGVGDGGEGDTVMPYLRVLSQFRDNVRELARGKADHKQLLELCDRLRDEELVELGVMLDDREGGRGKALVKLVDREELIRERDEKRRKQAKKLAQAAEKERKRLERLALGRQKPEEMFKVGEYAGQFALYDDKGIPTHDHENVELAKSRRKKLQKEWDAQTKRH
ncbi:tRNA synthetases class I (C) catalytic domain-containing protein, partial [Syncephalis pseudoplumigaleata]